MTVEIAAGKADGFGKLGDNEAAKEGFGRGEDSSTDGFGVGILGVEDTASKTVDVTGFCDRVSVIGFTAGITQGSSEVFPRIH